MYNLDFIILYNFLNLYFNSNIWLTEDFIERCWAVLCELWDAIITVRLTKKTEYESLPKITNTLLLNTLVSKPICNISMINIYVNKSL